MKVNIKNTSFQKEERQVMRAHWVNTFLPIPLMIVLVILVESLLSTIFSWYDGSISLEMTIVSVIVKMLICAGLVKAIFKVT